MMMYERTQETRDRILARDAADRAGQSGGLATTEQRTAAGIGGTPQHVVIFTYTDGRTVSYDGSRDGANRWNGLAG
jgi:hypothetical protein